MACIPQGFTLTFPLPSYIVRLFGWARKSTIRSLSGSTYTRCWGYRLVSGVPLLWPLFSSFPLDEIGLHMGEDARRRGAQGRGGGRWTGAWIGGMDGNRCARATLPARASLRCSTLRVGSFMQRGSRSCETSPALAGAHLASDDSRCRLISLRLPPFLSYPSSRTLGATTSPSSSSLCRSQGPDTDVWHRE
ncbi:hypothetical protein B0H14DRAFT_1058442 [Mycena olivaceomarginata]|nr:hypothetical protein B0H14DRAFT_1058442 [Mycena olivaceomarginata]